MTEEEIYEKRVKQLEYLGCTTSDAQAAADYEQQAEIIERCFRQFEVIYEGVNYDIR